MSKNAINTVRPNSLFSNFSPQTPEQEEALRTFRNMADTIVSNEASFGHSGSPFTDGSLWVVSGKPGTGKTHLLEALINEVVSRAPSLRSQMYLLRDSLTRHGVGTGIHDYSVDSKPIIFIDDAFADHHSVETLHVRTDLQILMSLITYVYESRSLCLVTTNFPFLNGILPRIKEADPVGRIYSRCQEILVARAGEMEIKGPDYREIIAIQTLAERGRKMPTVGLLSVPRPGGNS